MLKAVFFDLDGTLLPFDDQEFATLYCGSLYSKVKDLGYTKDVFIKMLYQGIEKMYQNNGPMTNEEVFWDLFISIYGKERYLKDKPIFDRYYENEFREMKSICKENPFAKKIVDFVNKNLDYCVLSTNPLFPLKANLVRMEFVGLNQEDFDYITSYENFYFCKPNPQYFIELLKKFNLKPEEVIAFGNNDIEDYECCKKVGIDCYLVGDNLILHDIECPKIKLEEIIPTIKKEILKRK